MKKLFKLYLAVIMLLIYGGQVRKYTPTLNYRCPCNVLLFSLFHNSEDLL